MSREKAKIIGTNRDETFNFKHKDFYFDASSVWLLVCVCFTFSL
jgi:hypothetical protein